jgi:hypothetical protein
VADQDRPDGSRRSDHAGHDRLLIAALAADDLTAGERERAEALVARCAPCAGLAADLRAIAQATSANNLPVPARPRSFTLRPDDAARLRPGGWRGFVRRFGSADWSFTRPLAAGLTTLGLAGLLVSALPGFPTASPAASPAASAGATRADDRDLPSGDQEMGGTPSAIPAAPSGAPAPAPSATVSVPAAASPGANPSDAGVGVHGEGASPGTAQVEGSPLADRAQGAPYSSFAQRTANEAADTAASRDAPSMLAILAGTSLMVGLGLFGLRWAGRRLD